MSLTRKFLKAMGIEDEKIDEIISAHSETVNALKEQLTEFKENAEKLPDVQKELNKLKEEKKKLEEAGEKDPYKVKYDAIKEEFDNYKKDIKAKETKASKEKAYEKLLKDAGVNEKRIAAVLKVSDIDKIEFDENGNVKDSDTLTKSIKEEWADFITTTETKGANVSNPPGQGNAEAKKPSKAAEIYKQHYTSLYGEQKGNEK